MATEGNGLWTIQAHRRHLCIGAQARQQHSNQVATTVKTVSLYTTNPLSYNSSTYMLRP